jgi:hypothetical protein
LGEDNHRDKDPASSDDFRLFHQIIQGIMLLAWLITIDIDVDHLPEVALIRFSHWKVTLISISILNFWKKVTMHTSYPEVGSCAPSPWKWDISVNYLELCQNCSILSHFCLLMIIIFIVTRPFKINTKSSNQSCIFLKISFYYYCTGAPLWHFPKFLQYFIVEFTLPHLFYAPPYIPGTVSIGLNFPFLYMST